MEEINNSKLIEFMKSNPTDSDLDFQNKLFKLLEEAQLYVPVIMTSNSFDFENVKEGDILETKEDVRFKPVELKNDAGEVAIPLFSSKNELEKINFSGSVMVMYTNDIVNMLKQAPKDYDLIIIDMASEHSVVLSFNGFIKEFSEKEMDDSLIQITNILKKSSNTLEEPITVFLRSKEPFMKDEMVDGYFIPTIPFNCSTSPEFHKEYPYLNRILLPVGTRILYIGNIVDSNTSYDMILAPFSKFQFVRQIGENELFWLCAEQPFYDEYD